MVSISPLVGPPVQLRAPLAPSHSVLQHLAPVVARAVRRARRRARRCRLICVLVDEVGIEPAHLARLRWTDVDLDRQLLWVPARFGGGRRRLGLTRRASLHLARAWRRARDPLGFVLSRRAGAGHVSVGLILRTLEATGLPPARRASPGAAAGALPPGTR